MRLHVSGLVLAALCTVVAGRASAASPDDFSTGPDVLVPRSWPDLEQARQAAVAWLRSHGREPDSVPGNDRSALVQVGASRELKVDVGPLLGPQKHWVVQTRVPQGDGARVELKGIEELPPDLRDACAAKAPFDAEVTLVDAAGHPAVTEHRFCDCATPALVVAVLTAPGADASFAAEVAHAALTAARQPNRFAHPRLRRGATPASEAVKA